MATFSALLLAAVLILQLGQGHVFEGRSLQGKCCSTCLSNQVRGHMYSAQMFKSTLLMGIIYKLPPVLLAARLQGFPAVFIRELINYMMDALLREEYGLFFCEKKTVPPGGLFFSQVDTKFIRILFETLRAVATVGKPGDTEALIKLREAAIDNALRSF